MVRIVLKKLYADGTVAVDLDPLSLLRTVPIGALAGATAVAEVRLKSFQRHGSA